MASPRQSPLLPVISGAGLALTVAAIVVRTFTSGGGIELLQPGTQILFDALALCAAFVVVLTRVLAREDALESAGWRLPTLGGLVLVLAITAARSPHPDVAWRTALTWTSLLLLGLTVRDLGRDPRTARLLASLVVACVVVGAALGIYQCLVEFPELQEQLRRGELQYELDLVDPSFQIGMKERIQAEAAIGPWLLPMLLACAICMVLPLAGAIAWSARRWRPRPGEPLAPQEEEEEEGGEERPRPTRWVKLLVMALTCAVVILLGVALLLTKSKGAVITCGGTAGVFLLLHPRLASRRRPILLVLLALAGCVLVLGLIAFFGDPERLGIAKSFTVRLEYWAAALAMWRDHPLLGVGLNGYREFFSFYKSARAEEALHAHNGYLQLLAETGVIGLLTCAVLAFSWIRPGLRALASAPGDDPSRDPGPDLIALHGLPLAVGFGLGLVLLAGLGDRYSYSVETRFQLGMIALGVPVATALAASALGRDPGGQRLLCAAALAGGSALLLDGLLDFGLHHAGVFALAWILLGLAPALGEHRPQPVGPRWTRGLAAGLIGILTIGVVCGLLPRCSEADRLRERARTRHEEVTRRILDGERGEEAQRALREALDDYDGAVDLYPWNARTWLERASVLRTAGRQGEAIDSARRAVECAPRAASAWNEWGHHLGEPPAPPDDLQRALSALDEAVRLYPAHPTYLLDAGQVRVRLLHTLRPGDPARARLAAEARKRLRDALEASETTRLVLRKLRPEQIESIERLLDDLGTE